MNQPITIYQQPPRMTRDPILNEPRYRMRVRVNTHSTSVYQADVEHHMLFRGEHEVVAYASQVPLIMAKVETKQAVIEQARDVWRRRRREAMEAVNPQVAGWRDVDPADYDKHPELRRIVRQLSYAAHADSVESIFWEFTGRGILPLSSAECIGEPLPALRPEQETAIASIVEQLGTSFGKQLSATRQAPIDPEQYAALAAVMAQAMERYLASRLSEPQADPAPKPGKNGRDAK